MAEVTTPTGCHEVGTTDESRRLLLEQFAERLQRRWVRNPDVVAVVSAARAEAFLEDAEGAGQHAIRSPVPRADTDGGR